MMIENISNISSFQSQDIKTEKKSETEDVRPIEESGEGYNAKLDIDKEKIAKHQTERYPSEEPQVLAYDAKGQPLDDAYADLPPPAGGEIMDLVA